MKGGVDEFGTEKITLENNLKWQEELLTTKGSIDTFNLTNNLCQTKLKITSRWKTQVVNNGRRIENDPQ